MNVEPAYGADYKSQKSVQEAWDAGKDFHITDMFSPRPGSYINKEDHANHAPGENVTVRYANQRKVYTVK